MPLLVGAPLLLLLFAASALPWLLVFRSHYGHLLAIPATATGLLLEIFGSLLISRALDANYMVAIVVGSVLVAGIGVVVAARIPGVLRRPGHYAVALWCPAFLGALVWIAIGVLGRILPGASRYGWVMNGDALNNLFEATSITQVNGVALGPSTNPVPLPAALIALGLGAGSPTSSSASAALAHELSAFALVWVVLLAATCIAMGVVVASLVPQTLTRTVAVVSAIGSLLPLTWFVSGLTIQWGYFNIDVLLPLFLCAWLAYLGSAAHPVETLLCLLGLTVLMLATWTPVALLIAALGVALVLRHWRLFLAIRGWKAIVLILGIASPLAFLAFSTFPTLISQGGGIGGLAATGSGFLGFVNLWGTVPILVVLALASLLVARTRTTMPVLSAIVAILSGSVVATGLLLYLAQPNTDLFAAYYPKKFAWIVLVILGVIVLSVLISAFAGRVSDSLVAIVTVVAVIAGAALPQGTWPEIVQRQPTARILGDYVRHDGEKTVSLILAFTSSTHGTILWQTENPDEPIINEWLLLAHGGLVGGNKSLIKLIGDPYFLYRASGRYSDSSVQTVCKALPLMHGHPVVITANHGLSKQLKSACPGVSARVVINTSLGGPRPTRTGEDWQTDGIEGPFH